MFFSENWEFKGTPGYQGTVRHHTPDSVTDGLTNTILLGENIRTGSEPGVPEANWANATGPRSRIYFSHQVCSGNSCATGNVDLSLANTGDHAINAGRVMPEGRSPFLNSDHPGGATVGFGDGHVKFLAAEVDGRVLFHLFTPQGAKLIGTPLDPGVLSDDY